MTSHFQIQSLWLMQLLVMKYYHSWMAHQDTTKFEWHLRMKSSLLFELQRGSTIIR